MMVEEDWDSITEGGRFMDTEVATGAMVRGRHGQVAERIGAAIATGEYHAGAQINPEALAERFDVSRTVVREVLKVLEAKGLVVAKPRIGTRVTPVTDWNLLDADVIRWRSIGADGARQIEELLGIRGAIEPLAARQASGAATPTDVESLRAAVAAMREAIARDDWESFTDADVTFHRALLAASGNLVVAQFAEPIEAALRVRHRQNLVPTRLSADVADSHSAIVEAIVAADGAEAELASRRIVDVAGAETVESLMRGAGGIDREARA